MINFLLEPYETADFYMIMLEFTAALLGILSVWFSRKENILVYPSGIVSTGIYVYLLNIYELRGDMVINAYFFVMSIYGWYNWSRKTEGNISIVKITRTNFREKIIGVFIFIAGVIFVFFAYKIFSTKITYITYTDSFTTAIFFVAMWYMALKKLENWTLWIAGNIVSIPLYLVKGLGFTAIQYAVFLILAVLGYIEWRKKV
ncbi:MAG: nicotinamide mononucleotide transporter [Chlorobi bacterium]|nr:nicotinamide mononucleotide transporter [Chlorobiota bacterium]